jgi:hypothetical protein
MLSLDLVGTVALWLVVLSSVMHCGLSLSMKKLTAQHAVHVLTCVSSLYLLYCLLRNGVSEQNTLSETGVYALWVVVLTSVYHCMTAMKMRGLMGHKLLCVVHCAASVYLLYLLAMNTGRF